jgi:hypothetical protein
MTKQGVLLDPQEINRKMADAEAEFVQEELFEGEAQPEPTLEISARTIHNAYTHLSKTTAAAKHLESQRHQLHRQWSADEIDDDTYDNLRNQLEEQCRTVVMEMELAKIEVDRVNALVHFFEIDLLAQAGRQ